MTPLLPFPDIGEVAFNLGPLSFRWYGLSYAVGILLAWIYIKRLVVNERLWGGPSGIKPAHIDDFLLWATLAVVLGGRIGYVLFYQPGYYLQNPEQIFYLNKGGMAFHGAAIAVTLVALLFARVKEIPFLSLTDVVTAACTIGIFFGRCANFINGELWGRVTDVPWAMIFPGADDQPRHPSQLYEAALEGILLFIVLRIATHYFLKLKQPGFVTGLFLAGYGTARSVVEHFFRQPDLEHPISVATPLTPGLLYSVPMILLGLYLIWRARSSALKKMA